MGPFHLSIVKIVGSCSCVGSLVSVHCILNVWRSMMHAVLVACKTDAAPIYHWYA